MAIFSGQSSSQYLHPVQGIAVFDLTMAATFAQSSISVSVSGKKSSSYKIINIRAR
jgi:hypothetical protein